MRSAPSAERSHAVLAVVQDRQGALGRRRQYRVGREEVHACDVTRATNLHDDRGMTGTAMNELTVTVGDDHIAVVEFDRAPDNYIDVDLARGIADAIRALDDDLDCRAIVLRSVGRHFCAGARLSPAADDLPSDAGNPLYEEVARMFTGSVPIIAVVQGAAIGAGLGLGARCRLPRRIAGGPIRRDVRAPRLPPGVRHHGHVAAGGGRATGARDAVHGGAHQRRRGPSHRACATGSSTRTTSTPKSAGSPGRSRPRPRSPSGRSAARCADRSPMR